MKYACLLLLCLCLNSAIAQTLGNPQDLPFQLSLEEVTQDELPGLHSFAFAHYEEWWIMIGGRINGLHGFFAATAFPEDKANTLLRLINPETGEMHTWAFDALNVPFKDALRATNPQYTRDGDWLYITGGYGKDQTQNKFITFPVLTAVNLPDFTTKMVQGQNPSSAFKQIELPAMRVCGGEMEKMGDYFYLVGGHDFSGLYNSNGPPQFTQAYINEIRRFKIQNTETSLSISDYSAIHDENNLHRRDFSMAPVVLPDGRYAIVLYGGVFRPDADLPFYNPIYITENEPYTVDVQYAQVFSQYTCPVVPIYDAADKSMYSIFFAGLSAYYPENNQAVYDERVPFIKSISTFRRSANGQSLEYVMPVTFDALLGSNMIFVPDDAAPHFDNEVLKLQDMNGPTFVGYLFGGIKADIPNITPSSASNRMFKVFITPTGNATAISEPENNLLSASPNPFSSKRPVVLAGVPAGAFFTLSNAVGQVLYADVFDRRAIERLLLTAPSGVYYASTLQQAIKLIKAE